MFDRTRLISVACALALVATLVPVMVVAASGRACHVRDLGTGVVSDGLRPALAAAAPGTTLEVRGTCWGSFVVRKPVRLVGVGASGSPGSRSGPAKIHTHDGRAALIIAPSVDAFEVEAGLRIKGGVVIAPPGSDLARSRRMPIPGDWFTRPGPTPMYLRDCRAGGRHSLKAAVADGHERSVVFFGRCWGRLRIDHAMHISGSRMQASSMGIPDGPIFRSDTGKPMVRSAFRPGIVVAAAVDELVLEAFVIRDGLRIGAGVG